MLKLCLDQPLPPIPYPEARGPFSINHEARMDCCIGHPAMVKFASTCAADTYNTRFPVTYAINLYDSCAIANNDENRVSG